MRIKPISVRLTDDEVAILNFLSQREGRSKTDIIREALEPIFKKFREDPERIVLTDEDYHALRDEMATPPIADTVARRQHLMTYERWK